jgi:phosphoheptose isomerase
MRAPHVVLLAAAAVGVACGGSSSSTSPSQIATGLVGTWRATRANYRSVANAALQTEVIAQGTTMTLVLESGGTFSLTIVDPGQQGNVVTGTWTSSRDVLTIVRTGQSGNSQFDMTLNGNTLTLTGGSALFDFESDGRMEEAKLDMTLTRQ